jgi:hypothetical protein
MILGLAFVSGAAVGGFGGCFAMAARHANRMAHMAHEMQRMRSALSVIQLIDADERTQGAITAAGYERARAIHELETALNQHIQR